MRKKKLIAMFLSLVLTAALGMNCYAQTTQQQIDSKKAQKKETQANYQSAQKALESLKDKKHDKQAYLTELNAQMHTLKENLAALQTQYENKKVELAKVQTELEHAEAERLEQYEDMKLRIQYMYENDTTSYVDVLLSSDSFSDFLNKAENISAIAEYDRKMLDRYEETVALVAEKEAKVQQEKAAIEAVQKQYEAQEEEVSILVEETYLQIREYEAEIKDSESKTASLLKQISKQEDELNGLLKKQKDEQAKALQEAKEKAAAEQAKKEQAAKEQAEKEKAEAEKKQETEKLPAPDTITQPDNKDEPAKEDNSKDETTTKDEASSDSNGEYLGKFKLTAYCACSKCCGKSDGITASGTTATQGRTVAMGGVPFGTKLSINGKIYIVEDRGTAYGHVDVFFSSHSDALQFGRRQADVYRLN